MVESYEKKIAETNGQFSQFTHSHIAKYRCKRTGLDCDTLSNLLRYCVGGWNCQVWGFFPGVSIYFCGYLWLLFGSMKDGKSPEPMSNTNVKPIWRGCLIWPICVCVCVSENGVYPQTAIENPNFSRGYWDNDDSPLDVEVPHFQTHPWGPCDVALRSSLKPLERDLHRILGRTNLIFKFVWYYICIYVI